MTDFYRTAEVSPGEFETRLVGEHTLWEGVAKLLPFVATSRKQEARFKLESASTQNAGLRDTFEYNDDFEQPFENFIESVNTFISSPSGNVADPSQFIIDSKTAPATTSWFYKI